MFNINYAKMKVQSFLSVPRNQWLIAYAAGVASALAVGYII